MSALFEELDFQATPMGELTLRRRRILALERDVYEVKLGDEFLMSSLFTVGEEALARLGLERATGASLDVVVGGLGLGHTALAALDSDRVRSLLVVEALEPVIGWHHRGLVPLGERLSNDPRCSFLLGDFFAASAGDLGFDPAAPARRFDVVLLDIDHSPEALLHASHRTFYSSDGLHQLARWLKPGGVFGMWSDAQPDADFTTALAAVFYDVEAEVVAFDNPLQARPATCTVYLGRAG